MWRLVGTGLLMAAASLGGTLAASPFDKGGIVAVGARAAGQAGALVARSDDASSLWWNPAGLDALPGFQVEAGYGSILASRSSDLFGAHRGLISELGLGYGLGYRQLSSSGAFKLTEQTTALGVAFPFSEDGRLGFGAAVKLYQSQLDVAGGEARGFGLDLGARWRPALLDDQLRIGVAVQDFQSGLEWAAGIRANPVQLFQGGLAWVYDRQTSLEIDYEYAADPQFSPRSSQGFKAGAERWIGLKALELDRFVALRLGYLQSNALIPTSLGGLFTLGLGLAYEDARIDYAYLQDVSALGETHRLSGSYSFGKGQAGSAPAPSRTPTPFRKTPTPTPTLTPEPTPQPTEAVRAGQLRLSPEADIFAPLAQSARPQAVLAVGYAGTDVTRWTLSVRKAAGRPALRVLTGKGLPAKLAWDGKDSAGKTAADGAYLLQLSALTASGGSLNAEARIDLDTRRPKLSLQAEPRLFEARSDGGNVSILLGLESSTGIVAKWGLRVETLEGTLVKTYNGKGTPPERILWAGVKEDGSTVAKGSLYTLGYTVEMESGAVARLPRTNLASKLEEPKQPFRVPLQTLRFNEGDEAVNLEDYRALKEASAAVKKYSSDYVLQVLGFCDRDEAATTDQIELSMLRAKAVRDYLVDSEGLDPAKVQALGYGVPAQANEDRSDDGKAKSRRVEIILYAK